MRLETGRYEGLEVEDHICPIYKNEIETEEHVITRCPILQHSQRNFI